MCLLCSTFETTLAGPRTFFSFNTILISIIFRCGRGWRRGAVDRFPGATAGVLSSPAAAFPAAAVDEVAIDDLPDRSVDPLS